MVDECTCGPALQGDVEIQVRSFSLCTAPSMPELLPTPKGMGGRDDYGTVQRGNTGCFCGSILFRFSSTLSSSCLEEKLSFVFATWPLRSGVANISVRIKPPLHSLPSCSPRGRTLTLTPLPTRCEWREREGTGSWVGGRLSPSIGGPSPSSFCRRRDGCPIDVVWVPPSPTRGFGGTKFLFRGPCM